MDKENCLHLGGDSYIIIKKYISRKNDVYLVENVSQKNHIKFLSNTKNLHNRYILKCFDKTPLMLINEENGIKKFKPFSPKIFHKSGLKLLKEYFHGQMLLEMFLNAEKIHGKKLQLINGLLKALYNLYSTTSNYILGDVNFKNFIVLENGNTSTSKNNNALQIRFIDYENVKHGQKEEDIAQIIAFSLTYRPMFTDWKYGFINTFLSHISDFFCIEHSAVLHFLKNEFIEMNKRRGLEIAYSEVIARLDMR